MLCMQPPKDANLTLRSHGAVVGLHSRADRSACMQLCVSSFLYAASYDTHIHAMNS